MRKFSVLTAVLAATTALAAVPEKASAADCCIAGWGETLDGSGVNAYGTGAGSGPSQPQWYRDWLTGSGTSGNDGPKSNASNTNPVR